jgi:hypothetical protein
MAPSARVRSSNNSSAANARGKQRLRTRLHLLAKHCIEIAVEQRLNDWPARRRAFRGIEVFG